MKKSIVLCDRVMYGALLATIFFLPYSLALLQAAEIVVLLAWGMKWILGQRPGRFPQGLALPLLAIGLLIFLTIPVSHAPALSLKKFVTRFLQQIMLMYLITQAVQSRRRLHGVLAMLMITMALVIVDIIIQYTCGRDLVHHVAIGLNRATGPMNHPNDLGTLLVTVLPVGLVLFLMYIKRSVPMTVLMGILCFLLINALGLTASRGAWLAFAVSMIILGLSLKRCKLTFVAVAVLLICSWLFSVNCLKTRRDMYDRPPSRDSLFVPSWKNPLGLPPGYNGLELLLGPSGRELYWDTAAGVIKHYPWFGCGYSAYMPTLNYLKVGHEEYPHNTLLQITAELGIIGLIFYAWFWTALGRRIVQILKSVTADGELTLLGFGLLAGLSAWFIHGLFDTGWASLQLSTLWYFFIGLLLSLGGIPSVTKGEKSC